MSSTMTLESMIKKVKQASQVASTTLWTSRKQAGHHHPYKIQAVSRATLLKPVTGLEMRTCTAVEHF